MDQARSITEKIEQMLRNDAILAYGELQTGRTQLNEAFRAESQAAQLAYDRILLEEQRASQTERFKSLLNLPPGTVIGPIRLAPFYAIADTVEPLYGLAEQHNELLKIKGLEIQKSRYQVYLAKLSRIPDLSLGVNFINTSSAGPTPAGTKPSDSGKDPVIGAVSMNLPIWEWRTRALIRERKAIEEAVRAQALEEANKIRSAVAKAYFGASLTHRLQALYEDTLLPQAEAVLLESEIYFRNDQAAFSNLIETTIAYHNFQLAYHRAIADHGQAIGRLEKAIGSTAVAPRTTESEKE